MTPRVGETEFVRPECPHCGVPLRVTSGRWHCETCEPRWYRATVTEDTVRPTSSPDGVVLEVSAISEHLAARDIATCAAVAAFGPPGIVSTLKRLDDGAYRAFVGRYDRGVIKGAGITIRFHNPEKDQ